MDRLKKIGFSKLTSIDDALERLFLLLKKIDTEEIYTNQALGRILVASIKSTMDNPPFDRSAMDGYAVKAEDTFSSSLQKPGKVRVIGSIEIGQQSQNIKINKGEAVKISTGAAIPKGADAVVKIEDTECLNNIVSIFAPIVPGKNVVYRGEDISQGNIVLKPGAEIRPAHIALLSSLGIEKVEVRKKPRVSVFATGDELIEVGNTLLENKIYNSNSPMISALIIQYGGHVLREETLKDDKDVIKRKLEEATNDSDIIFFSGGTSVGTQDFLPEIISEKGEVLCHGIAMKPGSPLLIGNIKNKIVFCLPGTPVAAYLCFIEIAGLALRKMMNAEMIDPRVEIPARISKDVPLSGMGYSNFLRIKIEKKEGYFVANPIKLKGSGIISSLTRSDGIVKIAPHREGLKKGDHVMIRLIHH